MLEDVYLEYKDSVDFYAISVDPTEDLDVLVNYRDGQDHPWPVSKAPATMLPQYNVLGLTTKIAIDRNGIIAFHGSGVDTTQTWRRVFQGASQV